MSAGAMRDAVVEGSAGLLSRLDTIAPIEITITNAAAAAIVCGSVRLKLKVLIPVHHLGRLDHNLGFNSSKPD